MHDYKWIGINASGQKIAGKINANNKTTAKQLIKNNDVTLLSLKKSDPMFSFYQHKKLSRKLRLDFTQQLHLLLQASIPLADALSLIASTSQHKIIQTASNSLKEKITQGISFATALADFPHYFDKTYCHIISAGEQSGQLEIVLTQLIESQEQALQVKSKIAKTLFYPISVLCIAIVIAIGLLLFVIPQFKSIYDNFGAQLPTMTRCLISLSHYLNQHDIFYFMVVVILFIFVKKVLSKNKRIKNKIDQLFFHFPLLKSLIITRQIAQWSQLLAMTLSAGIPLVDALHIANHAISQPILQAQMQQVRNAVIKGKSLRVALDACCYFPARAKTMIAIGENADSLPFMMKKMAAIYQQSLNDTLDRLSKLLEPVIMITVASLVSGLVIAMYLPIFKMGSIV